METYKGIEVYEIILSNENEPDYSVYISEYNPIFSYTIEEKIDSKRHRLNIRISLDGTIFSNLYDKKIKTNWNGVTKIYNVSDLLIDGSRRYFIFSTTHLASKSANLTNFKMDLLDETKTIVRETFNFGFIDIPVYIPLMVYDLKYINEWELVVNTSTTDLIKIKTMTKDSVGNITEYTIMDSITNSGLWSKHYSSEIYLQFFDSSEQKQSSIYKYVWGSGEQGEEIIPVSVIDFPNPTITKNETAWKKR